MLDDSIAKLSVDAQGPAKKVRYLYFLQSFPLVHQNISMRSTVDSFDVAQC